MRFSMHPHSGLATTTVLLEGEVEYEDTTGASGIMPAGGVEWMNAGRGVWHDGRARGDGPVRGYQLWVALPPELELGAAAQPVFICERGASQRSGPRYPGSLWKRRKPGTRTLRHQLSAGAAFGWRAVAVHAAGRPQRRVASVQRGALRTATKSSPTSLSCLTSPKTCWHSRPTKTTEFVLGSAVAASARSRAWLLLGSYVSRGVARGGSQDQGDWRHNCVAVAASGNRPKAVSAGCE